MTSHIDATGKMDRFLSHYILKLDAKGRVSVPAPFRAVLARESAEGVFCCPSLDRPAIEAGGRALLAEIEQAVEGFPPFSEEREQVAIALYGTSETLKMDGEGRVMLPDSLRDHAGIMDAVAFVGLGHKFQIWAPDRFSAQLSAATGKMRALRKALSAQGAAVTKPHGARE
jgi:MraZ protein